MAFDYGTKRIGIAVTDPIQIIATALTTIHPNEVIQFIKQYMNNESIEKFKDIYIRTAHAVATHNSQSDVTIRELKDKLSDKKNFFQVIVGIFSRKR